MSFLKVVGYTIVLLAVFYSLEKHGYRQSVKAFFENLMTDHSRSKRADSNAPTASAFYKETAQVTCGPVPSSLGFGSAWDASRSYNGNPLPTDSKYNSSVDTAAGTATLHIAQGVISDNGVSGVASQVSDHTQFTSPRTVKSSTETLPCSSPVYGSGKQNDIAEGPCPPNQVGQITAICDGSTWKVKQNNCVLKPMYDLLQQSQVLTSTSLPAVLSELSKVSVNFTDQVVKSPATIKATVQIFINVANAAKSLNVNITKNSTVDVLTTSGILTTAQESWKTINTNFTYENISSTNVSVVQNNSISSQFLQSLEDITRRVNESFYVETPYIIFNKTTFSTFFNSEVNSSVDVSISDTNGGNQSLTIVTFSSMNNVLPVRKRTDFNSASDVINGKVVLVQSSDTVSNVGLTFNVLNNSLVKPECVFWNFSLYGDLGGWDSTGCSLVSFNQTVTCNCSHLTLFSILMSPYSDDDPVMDYITYVGIIISMISLIICLIVEAVIWRKIRTNDISYLRHVSIVNIAVSLLVADIWFIIGAAISTADNVNQPVCTAATFFIHFFYLALFFWMLASALLLIYRTLSVFDGGLSKGSMLAIGFCLGYGAPLLIVTITIAVTAPRGQYIQHNKVCWLNWYDSKALLAFVIPAMTIVVINLVILLVVIYKMRRRAGGGTVHAAEKHVLVVIARALAILTPFFGITWGLGVGTLVQPSNRGIHITFALFNSLQGFFILVFGTLLDKKVWSELTQISQTSSGGTGSTNAENSSLGAMGFLQNFRRGRDGYESSGASASHSHANS